MLALSIASLFAFLFCFQFLELSYGKKMIGLFAALFLVFLIVLEITCQKLSGNTFNTAIVYHLQTGLEGAGVGQFKGVIFILASILFGFLLLTFWMTVFQPLSSRCRKSSQKFAILTCLVAFAGSIAFNPSAHGIYEVFGPHSNHEPLFSYLKAPRRLRPIPNSPNIVWIYGESLERTYFDESVFPGLTPHLKDLEKKSLSFIDIDQVSNTGWTIAGMVASQCGIPLVTTGGTGNSLDKLAHFLPGAICLGDLLKGVGYHLTYMGGAEKSFAGKEQFYLTHGFDEVLGYFDLQAQQNDRNYRNDWGINDDELFSMAEKKFVDLQQKKDPFGLFLLTIGTHQPNGYVARDCHSDLYSDGKNAMLNAVKCSDMLIARLVEHLEKLDSSGNTLFVIASDHLAMPNGASDLLEKVKRKNLLLFYWPHKINSQVISRSAATFSTGVTALDLMGFDIGHENFGRSLIREEPTLSEIFQDFNQKLEGWTDQIRTFWNLPKAPSSVLVNVEKGVVTIGEREYQLPVILNVDEKGVVRLMYGDRFQSLPNLYSGLDKPLNGIWIDSCESIASAITDVPKPQTSWCTFRSRTNTILPLQGTHELTL